MSDLICPDILVLGKALTGGYIGHAVTVANHKVYQGFYSDNPEDVLMHGPTFMGSTLACSVALKSIELFESELVLVLGVMKQWFYRSPLKLSGKRNGTSYARILKQEIRTNN